MEDFKQQNFCYKQHIQIAPTSISVITIFNNLVKKLHTPNNLGDVTYMNQSNQLVAKKKKKQLDRLSLCYISSSYNPMGNKEI